MKPGLDWLTTLLVLILLMPFLIIIMLVLVVADGRNPVFCQQRVGYQGAVFWLYKFRTMTDSRDKGGNLLPDADRVTLFGNWLRLTSIDELPQLINVLLGDMSLVGPRPMLAGIALELISHERHTLKPGITGWAQVHGRNHLSWDEKFTLDAWYTDHCSLAIDCLILWRTLFVLIDDSPPAKPYMPCYSTEPEATPAS